jgi:hypothetical protein
MMWGNPPPRPHPRKRRFAQGRRDSTAVQIPSRDFLGLSNYKAMLKISMLWHLARNVGRQKKGTASFESVTKLAGSRYSGDLRKYIEEGKKIIVSTVQKFPFILDEIATEGGKTFAIVIDEAHYSLRLHCHAEEQNAGNVRRAVAP